MKRKIYFHEIRAKKVCSKMDQQQNGQLQKRPQQNGPHRKDGLPGTDPSIYLLLPLNNFFSWLVATCWVCLYSCSRNKCISTGTLDFQAFDLDSRRVANYYLD